jgi:urease accessory protein
MSLSVAARPDRALSEPAPGGLIELAAEAGPDGRTYLSHRRQRFPLRVTVPLYLDTALPSMAFVYLQNPTGGLFEDDDLTVSLRAGADALVHLTTQSATKAYRAEAGCARQRMTLDVAAGAFLEYVPDPLIPHAGARVEQEIAVRVASGGAAIVAETVAPGRVASGEAFGYQSLSLTTRIACDRHERAVDTILLEPGELDPRRPGILGGHEYPYLVSLFAIGPQDRAEPLAESMSDELARVSDCLSAAAVLPSGAGVLARVLAPSALPAQRALRAAWSAARLGLAGVPLPPRRK